MHSLLTFVTGMQPCVEGFFFKDSSSFSLPSGFPSWDYSSALLLCTLTVLFIWTISLITSIKARGRIFLGLLSAALAFPSPFEIQRRDRPGLNTSACPTLKDFNALPRFKVDSRGWGLLCTWQGQHGQQKWQFSSYCHIRHGAVASKIENVGSWAHAVSTVVVMFAVHNYLLVIAHRPPIYFLMDSFKLIWE